MKVDRKILENALLFAINSMITSKEFSNKTLENIKRKLYARNIFNANLLLSLMIPFNAINIQTLYVLAEAIYEETGIETVNPKEFFLDSEIEVYKTYKKTIPEKDDMVEFENMLQVKKDHWIGVISIQYLVKLYNNLRISYNPLTQRESGYIEGKDGLIFVPKLHFQSVEEIKRALLGGIYEPDEITINLLKNGKDVFSYRNNKITIKKGRLDIIDGWHRSSAILKAVTENPELDMNFELRLVNFDIQKAREFIIQKNKQRKISETHIQSMSVSEYHNSITRALNESPKSDLKSKIVTTKHLVNRGYGIVTFDVIANAIKLNFDIKTRAQSEQIQNYLIDFFNYIYNLYYDEFNGDEGIYTKPFSFVGYIAIAAELYKRDDWEGAVKKTLDAINFTDSNSFYMEIEKNQPRLFESNIKKISKHFKEKVVQIND